MIMSMTGYGGAKSASGNVDFSVELKSVNNRYLDTSIHLPRSYIFAEESIKSAVSEHISRGKVDVFITIDNSKATNVVVNVNESLATSYYEALEKISQMFRMNGDFSVTDIARFQDVLSVEKVEIDREEMAQEILEVLRQALLEFDTMREREGERLRADIVSRLDTIAGMAQAVTQRAPEIVSDYRQRLEQKIRVVLEDRNIDEGRLLTETAVFADKVAIDEESVRLDSHISQFREMLDGGSPVGRKLDFLVQECNREVNTIGSKSNDCQAAKIVIDMKAELEKIREQIQNIE